MERTDVESPDDVAAMLELTQRVWPADPRWHVGEVAWSRYAIPGAAEHWRTALWREGDCPLAWGWVELPGDLSLVVDPSRPELVAEVLRWFDAEATGDEQTCMVLDTQSAVIEGLVMAGFKADLELPYFRYHAMHLADIPEPSLPDGFTLAHVRWGDATRRAELHRACWSEFGSSVNAESFAEVMAAWPYRPELDWVVVAPSGSWVASALGWLDDANRAGILEPVGCVPAYRRRGLASAVNLACMNAMRRAGALTAHVNPRGDDGYPKAAALYRSIGFGPGSRTVTYVGRRR